MTLPVGTVCGFCGVPVRLGRIVPFCVPCWKRHLARHDDDARIRPPGWDAHLGRLSALAERELPLDLPFNPEDDCPMTAPERTELRKLQDDFLGTPLIRQFARVYGLRHPLWEDGPSWLDVKVRLYPQHEGVFARIVRAERVAS